MMPIHINRTINDVFPMDESNESEQEAGDTRWKKEDHILMLIKQNELQQMRISANNFED